MHGNYAIAGSWFEYTINAYFFVYHSESTQDENIACFCFQHFFVLPGCFRLYPTQWHYQFSAFQPFSNREGELPSLTLVLRLLRVLRRLPMTMQEEVV